MVNPVSSSLIADASPVNGQSSPAQVHNGEDPFVRQLLRLLQESMDKLGMSAKRLEVSGTSSTDSPDAQNSSRRRFVVEFSPIKSPGASSTPTTNSTPYVPFDKNIAASDISAINTQQTGRNAAFKAWVDGISSKLGEMGYSPEVTFDETPENWYVIPVTAKIRLPEVDPNFETALTLYHYDAWQDADTASIILQRANSVQNA